MLLLFIGGGQEEQYKFAGAVETRGLDHEREKVIEDQYTYYDNKDYGYHTFKNEEIGFRDIQDSEEVVGKIWCGNIDTECPNRSELLEYTVKTTHEELNIDFMMQLAYQGQTKHPVPRPGPRGGDERNEQRGEGRVRTSGGALPPGPGSRTEPGRPQQ